MHLIDTPIDIVPSPDVTGFPEPVTSECRLQNMSEIQIPQPDQQTVNAQGESISPLPYGVTFRDAITQANSNPGPDVISFNLPGAAQIHLTSPLPAITEPVRIDGTTQPGYAGSPLLQIDGSLVSNPATVSIQVHKAAAPPAMTTAGMSGGCATGGVPPRS